MRRSGWWVVALVAVWLGGPGVCLAEEALQTDLPVLENLDFEAGEPGEVPVGWFVPDGLRARGFTGVTVEENPEEGARCALVTYGSAASGGFGNLMRSFDATPYRGQRVRFSAAVRSEVPGNNGAQLWLRVDRVEGKRGFFDNMYDRQIVSREWGRYEIVGEVAEDAQSINLGLMLGSRGQAWIDSVRFEVLGTAGQGLAPPRALAGRGLENLEAFTRLLGYVRYFHPSDEASETDWDTLALAGVQAVEGAASSDELAVALERMFRPVAPSLQVFSGKVVSDTSPPPLEPPSETDGLEILSWRHLGVGIDGNPSSTYQSQRITHPKLLAGGAGFLSQWVDVERHRGQRLQLRATARAETAGEGGAVLWFEPRTQAQTESPGAHPVVEDGMALGSTWQTVELDLEIGEQTRSVGFGLQLRTPGKAWLDDVSLVVIEDGQETEIALDNPGLDQGWPGSGPRGWTVWPEVDGLRARVDKLEPFAGSGAGLLEHDLGQSEDLPDPATPWVVDLGGGVHASIPLALWKDSTGTLPRAEGSVPAPDKPEGFQPSGDDRDTRLAAVVLSWNIFQHFYPYFDVVEADWPATLRQALTNAATDADAATFLTTLRRLVVDLHDGHGFVSHRSDPNSALLPLRWEWVEDELVVTEVGDGGHSLKGLTPGSVVVSIDGVSAAQALDEIVSTISGATSQWRTTSAARRLAATEPGRPVALEVRAPSGETRQIEVSPVTGQGPPTETRPEKISELESGIVYVDLSRIDDEDFQGALDQLAAARGIVFDLRGYPGKLSPVVLAHLTDEPVNSAQWHVPVFTRPDRDGMEFDMTSWNVAPKEPRLEGNVAFLTDGRAISYAETYLGIVEHYKLADIVGSPTAGTNGNVNPFQLPGGYRISWTGMKVLKHDGSRHHGIGILPTIPVQRTIRGIAEGRDEVLERGLEAVRE